MISFKNLWEEVNKFLSEDKFSEFNITQKLRRGFIVKQDDYVTFVTRDDFVDFWCNMLYSNGNDLKEGEKFENPKQVFIYKVMKKSNLKLIN